MAADLDDVVLELKSIAEQLTWYEKDSTAKRILEALSKISNSMYAVEVRLEDVEKAIRER